MRTSGAAPRSRAGFSNHILGEVAAGQVGLGNSGDSMQNLDVLLPDKQLPGPRAFDLLQGRFLLPAVNLAGATGDLAASLVLALPPLLDNPPHKGYSP